MTNISTSSQASAYEKRLTMENVWSNLKEEIAKTKSFGIQNQETIC